MRPGYMKDRIGTDGLSGLERIYKPAGTDLQVIEISGEPPRSGVEPGRTPGPRLETTRNHPSLIVYEGDGL